MTTISPDVLWFGMVGVGGLLIGWGLREIAYILSSRSEAWDAPREAGKGEQ